MKFQGIALRIIVNILMSGAPTGKLPGGVWRRPQGAVKRCRRRSLNTPKSGRKSSKRFLEISCFFKVFTTFRGPRILHGIAFFSPDSWALKTPTQRNALDNVREALQSEICSTPKITPRFQAKQYFAFHQFLLLFITFSAFWGPNLLHGIVFLLPASQAPTTLATVIWICRFPEVLWPQTPAPPTMLAPVAPRTPYNAWSGESSSGVLTF